MTFLHIALVRKRMMPEIKYVKPSLHLSAKTAIVGSSNCLLKTKYGDTIDQYDDVIRFNRAPTGNFEEHVGSKCTLRAVNIHVYSNIDAEKFGFTKQPRSFIKNLQNSNILVMADAKNIQQQKSENTHESTKLYEFQWGQIEKVKGQFGVTSRLAPTIGTIAIFLCIMSGITPHLYGFYDDGSWGHYWEGRPPSGPCHDIGLEKKNIKRLDKEGRLRLFK